MPDQPGPRTPTVVWRVSAALVRSLDERIGTPLDSYVNGTQSWLTGAEDPRRPRERDATAPSAHPVLEWQLHPVASYRQPSGLSHYDVWESVVSGLAGGSVGDDLPLGRERRPLTSLWDGLECFPASDDDLEPASLARLATDLLGIPPDAQGLVDHERIGRAWERARRSVSLTDLVLAELQT